MTFIGKQVSAIALASAVLSLTAGYFAHPKVAIRDLGPLPGRTYTWSGFGTSDHLSAAEHTIRVLQGRLCVLNQSEACNWLDEQDHGDFNETTTLGDGR